jgi:hypothetical protein
MNGTWADVTGRIQVTHPAEGSGWSVTNSVVRELHMFQDTPKVNVVVDPADTEKVHVRFSDTEYTQTGEGHFNNYWEPHESRLIMLQGKTAVSEPWTNDKAPAVLKSGKITFKTIIQNNADYETKIVNKTLEDTWSISIEIKQVELTQNGNSYIYNNILSENQMFQPDKFDVEVFVKPRS